MRDVADDDGATTRHCVLRVPMGSADVFPADVVREAGLVVEDAGDPPSVQAGPAVILATDEWAERLGDGASAAVAIRVGSQADLRLPLVVVPSNGGREATVELLRAARHLAESRWAAQVMADRASLAEQRITALNEIGIALSAERDLGSLLALILREARGFTSSAAGSLYLLDDEAAELRFLEAQCDDVAFDLTEVRLPVEGRSIAGYVARTGHPVVIDDVYTLSPSAPYVFNPTFDQQTGFRTCAMVAVPMLDHERRLVGVLQLMNPVSTTEDGATYAPCERRS